MALLTWINLNQNLTLIENLLILNLFLNLRKTLLNFKSSCISWKLKRLIVSFFQWSSLFSNLVSSRVLKTPGQIQSNLFYTRYHLCIFPLSLSPYPITHRPIYRRNLLNPSRTRECLRSKGYKFFGKLSAAGPETLKILQDIKKSHCIKSIHYFEFDH